MTGGHTLMRNRITLIEFILKHQKYINARLVKVYVQVYVRLRLQIIIKFKFLPRNF